MEGGQSFFRKHIIKSAGCQDQRITEEILLNPFKDISPIPINRFEHKSNSASHLSK